MVGNKKKDNPESPVNQKAGVWNNHGAKDIRTATLQTSDMTLRITDPFSGEVKIMTIDEKNKTIEITSKKGAKFIYRKVPQ